MVDNHIYMTDNERGESSMMIAVDIVDKCSLGENMENSEKDNWMKMALQKTIKENIQAKQIERIYLGQK